jgi:hypothetical protein
MTEQEAIEKIKELVKPIDRSVQILVLERSFSQSMTYTLSIGVVAQKDNIELLSAIGKFCIENYPNFRFANTKLHMDNEVLTDIYTIETKINIK